MTTTGRMLGLILILTVPPALAEKAVKSDDSGSSSSGSVGKASGGDSGSSSSGSSSSGSSSSGSSRGGSSGGSSSTGKSGYDGGSSGYSGGSSSGYGRAQQSDAERRSPSPSSTRGDRDRDGYRDGHYYSGGRRVLYGHYGSHYHGTIYYPHSCYDHHYWDYPYRYRSYNSYDPTGAVRVLVDPNKTKVYVDGYYAGIADDFDGIFQRLYLPPGRHQIMLKLDGFKSHRVQIYSARGHTIKLHHDMIAGEGEDEPVDMAGPLGEDEEEVQEARRADDDETDERSPRTAAGLGTLRVRVIPKDASVYVDGEFWGTGSVDDLSLPAGRHEIAVVRPGFRSYEREIEVRPGAAVDLEIALRKTL